LVITFISIGISSSTEIRKFIPRSNAHVTNQVNYLENQMPCLDDILSFSANGEQPVVAVIDKPIDVSEIEFPSVGVLYLLGDVEIGGLAGTEWQCEKRQNASYAYFDEYVSDFDVYDPTTWMQQKAFVSPPYELHMNRVPGAHNAVETIEKGIVHFKIFEEFSVKEWKDYTRDMTTDDFVERLRTLEGQLTLQLGAKLTKEIDVDGIALMRPIGEPIRVGEFKGSWKEEVYGTRNPNMDNKTLSIICSRVHCDAENERVPPRCIETFTPRGHCCPVCGALYEVQTYVKTINDLELVFGRFKEEFLRKNKRHLNDLFHDSLDRIDDTEYELRYQIVFIVKDTTNVVDEDLLFATANLFVDVMDEYIHPTEGFQLVLFKNSARDHSYEPLSIVLGCISGFFLVIIAIFGMSVEARNYARVVYRRGRLAFEELRKKESPAEVEMVEQLVPRGEDERERILQAASSECESDLGNPISFANKVSASQSE
ncbi:hypothetical protein PMAYCL1PPCAC_28910, partial [Pristionchus mayeri]